MNLILKDGTVIQLLTGNDQNKFTVSYSSDSELAEIESKLTNYNLSDAQYTVNDAVVSTIKNKVLSGTNKSITLNKATFFLTDAKTVEMIELQALVAMQQTQLSLQNATIGQLQKDKTDLEDLVIDLANMFASLI